MNRAAKNSLTALLAAALIVVGGLGMAWLAGTTENARWFMDAISRHTSLKITARTVEGSLDRLHLGGVRLSLPPLEVEIESLDYRWQPLLLLAGRITMEELTLKGMQIRDNTPQGTPPDLAWPRVSGIASFFSGRIGRLKLNGLTYRRLDGQPVSVTAISASASWRSALLSLSDLAVISPAGSVTGNIAADFDHPSLRFDLVATPANPAAGMDTFPLQGRFIPGRIPEQLAGGVTVAGYAGKAKLLELTGQAGITRNALKLRQLHLTRPGRRGVVTGGGTITLTAQEPLLELQLLIAGIDLTSEIKAPTDLSGSLTLTGTPGLYRGKFSIDNRGKGWQAAQLSGLFQGDSRGVKAAPLKGTLLAGSVQGSLDLGWRDEVSLKGALHGRNLNPAVIAPGWAGMVNFDLAGDAAWPNQAPFRGEVSGRLLESRLHGQALIGEVQADFADNDIHVGNLSLRGKGFNINAAGDLGKRLAFAVQIGDLSRLVPETAGELRADGWVRWRDGRLDGALTGRGGKFVAGGLKIAAANLTAQLGEGKGYPLRVAAKLHKAAYGRFQADEATIEVDGTAQRHTVHGVLSSAAAGAEITLSGGYNRGSWQGEIVRCSGRDRVGPWSLAAPAALSATAGRISLASLVLTGLESERIEVAGELTREPLRGSVRMALGGFNLARANPWLLREIRLEGRLAGRATGEILPGERLNLTGQASLAQGKIRWQQKKDTLDATLNKTELTWHWQGALSGPASENDTGQLVVEGRTGASGVLTLNERRINVERIDLSLDGNDRGVQAKIDLSLAGGGSAKGRFSSSRPASLAIPGAGEVALEWAGIDLSLIRPWLPSAVNLEGRLAGRVTGKILPGERLDLTGQAALAQVKIHWQQKKDALDATLNMAELSWRWQGALRGTASEIDPGQLVVTGRTGASGVLTLDERRINVERIDLSLDGNDRGMQAKIDLSLAGGGSAKGRFSSSRPANLAIPGEGEVALEWTGIDLSLMRPWLPRAANLEGLLAGQAAGKLLPGQRFSLKGDAALSGGKARWQGPEGEINVNGRSASVSWDWMGEALSGNLTLALAEHGQIRGNFQLPLPARFPAAIDHKRLLQASLTVQVVEKGVLSSLFPGFVQESRGEINADLRIGGTWDEPKLEGSLKLAKAGAYLPTAGIRVKEVELVMSLEKDLIRIESLRAVSGPGHIEGTAVIRLKGWQVTGYKGTIDGERFQTVYLPELQILSTPKLTFEGTPKTLTIRGEVRLPELLIYGPPTRPVVRTSPDVILEGTTKHVEKASPLALDVQVRLALGDRVLVKMAGIDAQLDGGTDLTFKSLDKIISKGEIKVVKGRYRAYGVDLEIVRGRLFYAGGAINQPTLDILALRTVGDVRVGITAGGILQEPVIRLYSEPAMPDMDILAYIVFGHPLGNKSTNEQAVMIAQVAGGLLSKGQSGALQEQIKDKLGLSTLEAKTSSTQNAGRMGYQEVGVTPTGAKRSSQGSGVSETILTVGKYLTPQLYFSYGRSLFTGGNLFRLRYDIFKQWQIETQTGSESSVDLYYKIDFQ